MNAAMKKMTLALVMGVILPFAVLELGVRVLKPHWDLMEMTGRKFGEEVANPMAAWAQVDAFCSLRARIGAFASAGKTVNREGFISTPEMELKKPEGTVRIAFLGGSSTAGTGWPDLADEDTWPYQVAQMVQSNAPGVRVEYLNAGLASFSTFESLGRLQARVRFYEPDAVVVYHGWNDMYYWNSGTVTNMIRWRVQEDNGWSLDKTTRPEPYVTPQSIDPFVAWSQLLVRVRIRIWPPAKGEYAAGDATEELVDHFDPRGPEIFRTNLRMIRESAKVMGTEVFAVKQATLIAPGISDQARELCAYQLHGFDHDTHLEAFAAAYRVIDDEFASDRIIDASHLSGTEEYFGDHIHPTPEGARAIAEVVSRHLLRNVDALQKN